MKRIFFCLTILFLMLLNSCNKCNNALRGGITAPMSGTWKLTRINSPKTSQMSFPYKEVLQLSWASVINSSNYNEVTLRDSIRVSSLDFSSTDVNCDDNTVIVSYNNGSQRKYWLIDNNSQLEATDHVKQIGGASDTLRYFYTKIE